MDGRQQLQDLNHKLSQTSGFRRHSTKHLRLEEKGGEERRGRELRPLIRIGGKEFIFHVGDNRGFLYCVFLSFGFFLGDVFLRSDLFPLVEKAGESEVDGKGVLFSPSRLVDWLTG